MNPEDSLPGFTSSSFLLTLLQLRNAMCPIHYQDGFLLVARHVLSLSCSTKLHVCM